MKPVGTKKLKICFRRVVGNSMQPSLKQGNIVLGISKKIYKVGDIVLVKVSGKEVIKRIIFIKDNTYDIRGDNASSSTDSRNYGFIDSNQILAKVIIKI